jgi:hypothetical protein
MNLSKYIYVFKTINLMFWGTYTVCTGFVLLAELFTADLSFSSFWLSVGPVERSWREVDDMPVSGSGRQKTIPPPRENYVFPLAHYANIYPSRTYFAIIFAHFAFIFPFLSFLFFLFLSNVPPVLIPFFCNIYVQPFSFRFIPGIKATNQSCWSGSGRVRIWNYNHRMRIQLWSL